MTLTRNHIEATIRTYFDGCNEVNIDKMLSCMAQNAVHYFPLGAPQGPFVGARAIAQGWVDAVARLDSRWTIDRMIIDAAAGEAAIEWTHFKPHLGSYLRGDEWYCFDEAGLITEIRAYYACPPADPAQTAELGGFDYDGRGYSSSPPAVVRTSSAQPAVTTTFDESLTP